MNLRIKINSLMDDMVEYIMKCDNTKPLSKIFSAYALSYQYHNPNSKFFSNSNLLEKSWNNLMSGKEEWDGIIERKPNHTRDVVMWVMLNYLKITDELSDEQKEIIDEYILSVADEATTYSQKSLVFLDVPNHAILRNLACEYTYSITEKQFYRKKALRMRSYILHRFKDGISPELSLNYSPFNLILLVHLYEFTEDSKVLECIHRTADIIPVFIHGKTGDVIGIDNREMIKTVSLTPYGCLCTSMIMAANLTNESKYLSIAESAVNYIERYTKQGKCKPFPRWKCNPKITDTTGVIELMSEDTVTAFISYYLAMSDYYFPRNLSYTTSQIKEAYHGIKTPNICIIKKIFGESEAVISNIYPSPIAYVTPKTSLIGWIPSKEIYRKTRMSYCVASKDKLYVYSHPTKSHSTAFFHGNYIVWIHTIEKNKHSDIYWSAFLSIDSGDVLCRKEERIIKSKINSYNYPLDWILLPNENGYIGIATFGAKLAMDCEIQIIYKKDNLPVGDSSSILLVGSWDGDVKGWQDFLDRWCITTKNRNYIIKTPEGSEYRIDHRNHHTLKRNFNRLMESYKKFRVFI